MKNHTPMFQLLMWFKYPIPVIILLTLLTLASFSLPPEATPLPVTRGGGSVIFIHPDGASLSHWEAARVYFKGPDELLEWDQLDRMALYRGHLSDDLTATSNAGAVIHSRGVLAPANSFGLQKNGKPIVAASGKPLTIAQEALRAELMVGVINSGDITEPGTAAFLAAAPRRGDKLEIAKQVVQSGAHLIFSGGEKFLLPKGTSGRFTKADESLRSDGLNLIEWAKQNGYAIVYTARELQGLDVTKSSKILGVFAKDHTFNDKTEEVLRKEKLPLYVSSAPTIAQMTDAALRFFESKKRNFLLVVEEEGTDNFGNKNNARGSLEALWRADQAIGLARKYVDAHPRTLLLTAADSNAGGLQLLGLEDKYRKKVPSSAEVRGQIDGVDGEESAAFVAKTDRSGRKLPFAIVWATSMDVMGGIVARAHGMNSERMGTHIYNHEIYNLMYETLFGKQLKAKGN